MTDVVVTVPKDRWVDWLDEGQLPGDDRVQCQECFWEGQLGDWQGHDQGRGRSLGVEAGHAMNPVPEWHFWVPSRPTIEPGERVYVVSHGRLRGYAPLVRIEMARDGNRSYVGLVRHGGGTPLTLPHEVRGFQGWRYRWWEREAEIAFPDWQTENVR